MPENVKKRLILKGDGTFEKISKNDNIPVHVKNTENVNIQKRWDIRKMRPHLQNNDHNNITNNNLNTNHIKSKNNNTKSYPNNIKQIKTI